MGARRGSRRTRPTLARALAYSNPEILYKFMERWSVTEAAAAELFTETKRLLWVKHVSESRGAPFGIDPALRILDEMWHTFVLFTREYAAYCDRVYGEFLHHAPTTRAERDHARRNLEASVQAERERSLRQWRLVTEVAGEATLLRWYVELPLRYGPEFFATAGIPLAMDYRPPETLARRVAITAPPPAPAEPAAPPARPTSGRRRGRGSRATGSGRLRGTSARSR